MIAKFIDLDESIILNKNTSLKDFVYSTVSERNLFATILKDIVDEENFFSLNLTDGKPGEWCVMEEEEYSFLFVSFSDKMNHRETVNKIYVFRFPKGKSKEKTFAACEETFQFFNTVLSDEKEKAKKAAQFIRKLMHSSVVMHGSRKDAVWKMEELSKKAYTWD